MTTALLIIDMQMEMQHRLDAGQDHVNGDAPVRITQLAAAFRGADRPVVHVRHRVDRPDAPFHPDASGYPPMPCAVSLCDEAVFVKTTSSAFPSTDLLAHLAAQDITKLVVVGAVAGFCVNSTVRSGSDLGLSMTVARDAVLGFDLAHANLSAQVIFDVTMAHLAAGFAQVVDTQQILADLK